MNKLSLLVLSCVFTISASAQAPPGQGQPGPDKYHTAGGSQSGDHLADLAEVHVAGDELGEAVGHRDDRFAQVLAGYPGCAQQRARPGHVPAMGNGAGPQRRHGNLLDMTKEPVR
jgi:hypothetical protein